jgi:paraquat-inducible protein B
VSGDEAGALGQARPRRARRWGLVWVAPGAALLVVGWLALRALMNPTLSVEVLFDTAAGVIPGQTRVAYHGLDEGTVKSVGLAADGRRIRMVLALRPDARPLLHSETRFWIVGAKPSITDPQSLKSIFAGSSLEMAVGPGPYATHFIGADAPPPVAPGTPGRRFRLAGEDLGGLRPDASVFLHGVEVGKVMATAWDGDGGAYADVFVRSPYDREVRDASRFWLYSPLRISDDMGGVAAQLASPASLFVGGVAFNTPNLAGGGAPAASGATFHLYASQVAGEAAPVGPTVPYTLEAPGDVGQLRVGAPVRLRGFLVGSVTAVALDLGGRAGGGSSRIALALEPLRMGLGDEPGRSWTARVDAVVEHLIHQGLQASIAQDPPLIGAREVRLELGPSGRGAAVRRDEAGRLIIPAVAAPDSDLLLRNAQDVVATVHRVPIAEIGENARAITRRLRTLTASPELGDSLDHLDRTLARVDAITREAQPQVGPLVASLKVAADQVRTTASAADSLMGGQGAAQDSDLPGTLRQLNDAARSLRALADELERHPESLIRGKRPDR